MQFIKYAVAAIGLMAATTSAQAEERKAGSFEFLISASGGLSYMEIDSFGEGDISFGGNALVGFDIALNDDGVALGLEAGYDYLGEMDFGTSATFNTDGLSVGGRIVVPVGAAGTTRLVGGLGAIFWQSDISGTGFACDSSGCFTFPFSTTEKGTGVYFSGGVDFEVAGPLHAGVDLRFYQLAEDAAVVSPQFRLGLHF